MKKRLNFIAGVVFGKHFLNLVFGLSKRVSVNCDVLDVLLRKEKAVIVCCWHGRLLFPFYDLKKRNPVGLAGLHEDAEIITRIGEKMGWKMIRGSSSERGSSAFRKMVKMIRREKPLMFITPDGPKGPPRSAKDGAIRIAMATGAVLLPASGQCSRKWEAVNWETFVVPKPFGKVCNVYGSPIVVNRDGDITVYREMLEQELDRVERQADEAVERKK